MKHKVDRNNARSTCVAAEATAAIDLFAAHPTVHAEPDGYLNSSILLHGCSSNACRCIARAAPSTLFQGRHIPSSPMSALSCSRCGLTELVFGRCQRGVNCKRSPLGTRFKDSKGLLIFGIAAIRYSRIEDHGLKMNRTVANANSRGRLKSITLGMALPFSTHISPAGQKLTVPSSKYSAPGGEPHYLVRQRNRGGSFVDKTKTEKHFSGEK